MTDELAEQYRNQIRLQMNEEATRRLQEVVDPREDARLLSLPIIELVQHSDFNDLEEGLHPDLVPALMARLGTVRASLTGHGGALTVREGEVDDDSVNLVIGLDGACVACGAAPNTLSNIQNDLLADRKIQKIRFDIGILENYDGIVREFLIEKSGVIFC
jgi:Fe-S cluster biogenesis protein NfuA